MRRRLAPATHGADALRGKATCPSLLGIAHAKQRVEALYAEALSELDRFSAAAEPLRWLAPCIVRRDH